MPFTFTRLESLPEVVLIEAQRVDDERGSFAEIYKKSEFARFGIDAEFRQDDHSTSKQRWVLRGLHYQEAPHVQGKLVRCVRGEVFDVAVDVRRTSPTYGRWVGVVLRAETLQMLWVPPGFAHGFLTLSDGADVLYKHTAEYSQAHARRVRWDDPTVAIDWPIGSARPLLSRADATAPPLRWIHRS